jgi:hypothetical protein
MLSSDRIRFLQWLAGIVLCAWLIIRGIAPGMTTVHSDFGNYYVSAKLVAGGADMDSLYNNEWFHKQEVRTGVNVPGKFAPFPPVTAWLMLPLTSLSPINAQRVFTALNLCFIVLCVLAWKRMTGWSIGTSVLIILAGGAGITNNIAFGQLYLIMTALMLWSIIWIREGSPIAAGIILGAFTVIKYYPIVVFGGMFLLLFVEGKFERRLYLNVLVIGLLTAILLVAAQFHFFGREVMHDYLVTALLPHLASELSGQGMYSFPFQSWDSLARNLFVYDAQANPDPWLNWPAGRTVVKLAITTLAAASVLLILVKFRNSPDRKMMFIALPALAVMAILPASATYHFVLLLLPLGLLLAGNTLSATTRIFAIAAYVAIGFIPYELFARVAESAGVIFAYPRLWLISLLFLVIVVDLVRRPVSTLG